MKIKIFNENGSTLVLLVIIIGVIILIGTSLLNITVSQYKIKKSNSEIKRAFYIAEYGLNDAYLRVYDLIYEAAENSVSKADEYLLTYPDDLNGASLLFKNNYKLYILNNAVNTVYDNKNPTTSVTNKVGLAFISDKLTIKVNSKFILESGIEKIISADIVISVPDYTETKNELTDFILLLQLKNFNL